MLLLNTLLVIIIIINMVVVTVVVTVFCDYTHSGVTAQILFCISHLTGPWLIKDPRLCFTAGCVFP